MTSNDVWSLLCYIHVLRCLHSDMRQAAESDPDAIRARLLSDFRDWTIEYCQTASDALQRYQDEGQARGMEPEAAEFRKFLNQRIL